MRLTHGKTGGVSGCPRCNEGRRDRQIKLNYFKGKKHLRILTGAIILFMLSSSLWAQKHALRLSCIMETLSAKNEIVLKAIISNDSHQDIMIPLSNWEVDGALTPGDELMGHDDGNYIVHRVLIKPHKQKRVIARPSKGWFPDYDNLPMFLRVKSGKKDSIRIILNKENWKNLSSNKYDYELVMCYCTQKDFDVLLKTYPLAAMARIEEHSYPQIEIPYFRVVVYTEKSSVAVFRNQSMYIRHLLNHKIRCTPTLEK